MLSKKRKNIKNKIGNSYRFRKAVYGLLRLPIFTKNPLYSYLYMKNVRKRIKELEKPCSVSIENTNYCNISCVFCSNREMKRERGIMEMSVFKRIVDECADEAISSIHIQGIGEPLLDMNYIDKVKYAKEKGIESVGCVTNGILLTEEVSRGLISAGLDFLGISIDAATRETYARVHQNVKGQPCDKFDKIVENLQKVVALKKAYKLEKPKIQVKFKVFDLNEKEVKQFVEKFSPLADEAIVFMNILNWVGTDIVSSIPENARALKFPCKYLWTVAYIDCAGKMTLCCMDYESKVVLGDLRKESLMDVWHGQKLKEIREAHLARDFSNLPLCKECVVNTHYVSPWW